MEIYDYGGLGNEENFSEIKFLEIELFEQSKLSNKEKLRKASRREMQSIRSYEISQIIGDTNKESLKGQLDFFPNVRHFRLCQVRLLVFHSY